MSEAYNALGRGLDSMRDEAQAAQTPVKGTLTGFRQMDVADILVPPDAARVSDDEIPPLLVDSVRDYGVLQPLLVRKAPQGYMLIDGRKRLAAANRCELSSVPVMVMRVSPEDADSLRSAANWRSSSVKPTPATVSFAHLDKDDTRPPSHGNIRWIYVVTGVVLLLFLVADIRVRTRQRAAREPQKPAKVDSPERSAGTQPPAVSGAQDEVRPQLAGDLPEPKNPEPLKLPPPADDKTVAQLAPPVHGSGEDPAATGNPPVEETATRAPDTTADTGNTAGEAEMTEPPVPPDSAEKTHDQAAATNVQGTAATPTALAITGEGIDIRATEGGIQIVFESAVFRFRTVMHETAMRRLKDVATQLVPVASELAITVVGHTDSDPMPPNARYADNTALGLARAKTAVDFLVKTCGLPAASVSAASWGESNAPYPNDAYDSRVRNRTVSLVIAPGRAED